MSFLDRMAFSFAEESLKNPVWEVSWNARGMGFALYSGTENVQASDEEQAKRMAIRRVKNRGGSDLHVTIVNVKEDTR
ncbi:hypothetical protein DXQ21_00220 [Listeria monocytogenes]|nr:hypothetical protein [Listeria monocytogenes]